MSDSLSQVFSEHYQSVYRLALSLSGNHADAEDIAQEAFVAIIRALPKFRGDAKLSTWIYRIALRVGTRWLAKRGAVAEVLAIPADTVASRLHYARKRLIGLLDS